MRSAIFSCISLTPSKFTIVISIFTPKANAGNPRFILLRFSAVSAYVSWCEYFEQSSNISKSPVTGI